MKSMFIVTNGAISLSIQAETIEKVESLTYFGSVINSGGKYKKNKLLN